MTPSRVIYVAITLTLIYHAILCAMLGSITPVALKHYHAAEAEDTISLSTGIIIALWLLTVFYAIVVGVVLSGTIILTIMNEPIQTLQPTTTDVHTHISTSTNAYPEDNTQPTTKPTRSFLVQGRNIAKDLHSSSSSDEESSGGKNSTPHPHRRRASSKRQAPPIEGGSSDSGSIVPNGPRLTLRRREQIRRETVKRGHIEHLMWLRSEVLDRYPSLPLEGEELDRGTTEENIPVSMRKLRLSLP